MKKQRVSKINSNSSHIPELDDYELPAEVKFDRRKARRNPYAGHVKFVHGGARKNAGRKRLEEPVERHTVTLFKSHAQYLRSLDKNLSSAIRKLIAKSK